MTQNRIGRYTLAIALLAAVAWGTPAAAALEAIEQAYELSARQILRWPLRTGDHLLVRPCDTCDTTTLQVTESTRFSTGFNTPDITLRDLLREKTRQGGQGDYLVVLFYTPDNRQVTRMILRMER